MLLYKKIGKSNRRQQPVGYCISNNEPFANFTFVSFFFLHGAVVEMWNIAFAFSTFLTSFSYTSFDRNIQLQIQDIPFKIYCWYFSTMFLFRIYLLFETDVQHFFNHSYVHKMYSYFNFIFQWRPLTYSFDLFIFKA